MMKTVNSGIITEEYKYPVIYQTHNTSGISGMFEFVGHYNINPRRKTSVL
jgi:hypothetical protein